MNDFHPCALPGNNHPDVGHSADIVSVLQSHARRIARAPEEQTPCTGIHRKRVGSESKTGDAVEHLCLGSLPDGYDHRERGDTDHDPKSHEEGVPLIQQQPVQGLCEIS